MIRISKSAALFFSITPLVASGAFPALADSARPAAMSQDPASQPDMKTLATKVLGLKFDDKARPVRTDDAVGFQSDRASFGRRLNSRTFIAYDARFSDTQTYGTYAGSDDALMRAARDILTGLQIPAGEIASVQVMQEKSQLGQRNADGSVKLENIELGKKYALATRKIDDIPVFSSRALISLMKDGSVGYMEVHWPVIPKDTIAMAERYRAGVAAGWHAPVRPGTQVESVTAGIVHSPAAGTAMDIYPAIRVIYALDDKRLGKKPVGYYDLDGKALPQPRIFLKPPPDREPGTRAAPTK
jgi:hypothetical protein